MKKAETVNMVSHLAGAIGMAVATTLLIANTHIHGASLLVVIIYAMSTILLFSASALYHFNKKLRMKRVSGEHWIISPFTS